MKVGLFIPCYIDQFAPSVAIATTNVLEKLDVKYEYPLNQTCCGQPLANSGFEKKACDVYKHFVNVFSKYEYIVTPSGSCAYHVKHHFDAIEQNDEVKHIRAKTYDLVDFLTEVLGIKAVSGSFPHKVGVHLSCHSLRGLRQATSSEIGVEANSKIHNLLSEVRDLELINLTRTDECCGFGGIFSFNEEAVSSAMGYDRASDHLANGAQIITSGDHSCLTHLDGIIKRNKFPLTVMHIAEILDQILV